MTSIQRQRVVRLVLFLALSASGARAQSSQEPATFGFAPVDGQIWVKEIEAHQVRDMADVAPRQEMLTTTRIEIRYEQVPDGWVAHQLPLEAKMDLDGAPISNPGLEQTVGHEIRVHLDDKGHAHDVQGFPELMRRLEAKLDPQTYAQLRQQMSVETMKAGEMRQWNELLDELHGQTVTPGEIWYVLDQTVVSGGMVVGLAGYLEFDGWTELDGMRAFKMTFHYDSSGERLASVEGQGKKTISRRTSENADSRSNVELQGSVVRVIIPETGQLLYEVKEEWYQVPLQSLDGPKLRMDNRHTYRIRRDA